MQNIEIVENKEEIIVFAKGSWRIDNILSIYNRLLKLGCSKKIIFDFKELEEFDTTAVITFIKICRYYKECTKVEVRNYTKEQYQLYTLLKDTIGKKIPIKEHNFLYELGKKSIEALRDVKRFIEFLGEFTINFFYFFIPKNFKSL